MANKKVSLEELKQRADQESQNQVNDIFSQISNLGSSNNNKSVTYEENENIQENEDESTEDIIPVKKRKPVNNKTVTSKKEDKPGYVSLVIPNSLKKKWKTFCNEHGISLTDCIKASMKLLEDMERKEAINLEDGVISYLN